MPRAQKGQRFGGRTKGTPNKLTASVKAALEEAFEKLGGIPSLVKWGKENQAEFYTLWVKILPKEIISPNAPAPQPIEQHTHIHFDVSKLADDELELYRRLAARAQAQPVEGISSGGNGSGSEESG